MGDDPSQNVVDLYFVVELAKDKVNDKTNQWLVGANTVPGKISS